MNLKQIGVYTRNWVDPAQGRDYYRALVNAALNFRVQLVMCWLVWNLFGNSTFKAKLTRKRPRIQIHPLSIVNVRPPAIARSLRLLTKDFKYLALPSEFFSSGKLFQSFVSVSSCGVLGGVPFTLLITGQRKSANCVRAPLCGPCITDTSISEI